MHHHHIDRFAHGNSFVHRLDARAKLAAVLAYTVTLISFDRYAVAVLAPMAIGPAMMLAFGGVPVWFALRRAAFLCPFIATLALLSPLYDAGVHTVAFGPWAFEISGGWLTAADVTCKFTLGVVALTALMCTTPFALLWILPGLACSIIHPGITEMDSAFPTLVQSTLPPILLGLVACGLLSSQMSTIVSASSSKMTS